MAHDIIIERILSKFHSLGMTDKRAGMIKRGAAAASAI